MRSVLLAVSWLTVVPVGAVDLRRAGAALRWAPVVGLGLGGVAGTVFVGLRALGVPALVGGFVVVGFLALVTRGMHIDGLADSADGLGCYGPSERALAVMADGATGPFGVVALIVACGVQAAALANLPVTPTALATLALACAVGRAGFIWCARRGVAAARPSGLGAVVAGSQRWWAAPAWWAVLAVAGYLLLAGWRAVLAVGLAAAFTVAVSAHTRRRFGGMSGDVLGAVSEIGTTTVLAVLAGSVR